MNTINEEDKENELVQISRGELNRLTKRDAEVEILRKENEILRGAVAEWKNLAEHDAGEIAVYWRNKYHSNQAELAALKKQVETQQQTLQVLYDELREAFKQASRITDKQI